jgi:hypothetical protein
VLCLKFIQILNVAVCLSFLVSHAFWRAEAQCEKVTAEPEYRLYQAPEG